MLLNSYNISNYETVINLILKEALKTIIVTNWQYLYYWHEKLGMENRYAIILDQVDTKKKKETLQTFKKASSGILIMSHSAFNYYYDKSILSDVLIVVDNKSFLNIEPNILMKYLQLKDAKVKYVFLVPIVQNSLTTINELVILQKYGFIDEKGLSNISMLSPLTLHNSEITEIFFDKIKINNHDNYILVNINDIRHFSKGLILDNLLIFNDILVQANILSPNRNIIKRYYNEYFKFLDNILPKCYDNLDLIYNQLQDYSLRGNIVEIDINCKYKLTAKFSSPIEVFYKLSEIRKDMIRQDFDIRVKELLKLLNHKNKYIIVTTSQEFAVKLYKELSKREFSVNHIEESRNAQYFKSFHDNYINNKYKILITTNNKKFPLINLENSNIIIFDSNYLGQDNDFYVTRDHVLLLNSYEKAFYDKRKIMYNLIKITNQILRDQ